MQKTIKNKLAMFNDLNQNHILKAIASLLEKDNIRKTTYGVWWHGETLSPAGVISKAYEILGSPIDRNLFTTDNAQKRLLELGFPIVDTSRNDGFFTEKDINTFHRLVKRNKYDESNEVDLNIAKYLNFISWEKTRLWNVGLKGKGWLIKGYKHWNTRSRTKGQTFKQYTWYRVLPENFKNELIFFTVGIDTEQRLVYKIDIRRNDPYFRNGLDKYFDSRVEELGIKWQFVDAGKLNGYTFKKLVDESHKFFIKQLKNYFLLSDELFSASDKRLMRLTWNTNNWESPSGHPWKKKNQRNSSIAHENQYGYGHEEWLFNPKYRVNGFQYGYIRGVETLSEKDEVIEEVILYTLDDSDKKRYIVGSIKNIEIIEGHKKELDKVMPLYEDHFDSMLTELKEVNADYGHLNKIKFYPNVKFKWSDLTLLNELRRSKFLELNRFPRYNPYKVDYAVEIGLEEAKVFKDLSLDFQPGKASTSSEYEKETSRSSTTVKRTHSDITESLYDYLQSVKGLTPEQVSIEKTRVGSAIVDAATKKKNSYTLYEVKTNGTGLRNIRQALGQLFEYAFLDHSIKLEKLVIIGPAELNDVEKKYFSKLTSILDVALEYWAFIMEEKDLKSKFKKQ